MAGCPVEPKCAESRRPVDRKSTRLNSSHVEISYAVFCLKKKNIKRKLYPNVHFYSGLIYRAMGFSTQLIPVLFAMGRLHGGIAHWVEKMESPETTIVGTR